LLHSRQIKFIQQVGGTYDGAAFPIVSDFEHPQEGQSTGLTRLHVRYANPAARHAGAPLAR